MSGAEHFDIVVIGSGPAGQKAAIQGCKAGRRVAVIERAPQVGGACVHSGTIPSKALREAALRIAGIETRPDLAEVRIRDDIELATLTSRVGDVVLAHVAYMNRQLERNGVHLVHGRARFVSDREVVVQMVRGTERRIGADFFLIATGSRPRTPDGVPIDHEHILDSDSVLSLVYLPRSLAVLGGGVIATEYASVFARLGVSITMIDKTERPLRFMDEEIVGRFLAGFRANGGRYLGGRSIEKVEWDGLSSVRTTLGDGEIVATDKLLCALGRVANIESLDLAAAGLAVGPRGHLEVDEHCRTAVPHIYAAGDVIGPPALASTSMEQGRRAACHALGIEPGASKESSPIGIYSIPELASVGIDAEEATRRHGGATIGRARFDEVARGQISDVRDGLLKLVADPAGERILGVHIVGEGATELIHIGQMAILSGWHVEELVESIFNFPTLAEAYRVAALDLVKQLRAGTSKAA